MLKGLIQRVNWELSTLLRDSFLLWLSFLLSPLLPYRFSFNLSLLNLCGPLISQPIIIILDFYYIFLASLFTNSKRLIVPILSFYLCWFLYDKRGIGIFIIMIVFKFITIPSICISIVIVSILLPWINLLSSLIVV